MRVTAARALEIAQKYAGIPRGGAKRVDGNAMKNLAEWVVSVLGGQDDDITELTGFTVGQCRLKTRPEWMVHMRDVDGEDGQFMTPRDARILAAYIIRNADEAEEKWRRAADQAEGKADGE